MKSNPFHKKDAGGKTEMPMGSKQQFLLQANDQQRTKFESTQNYKQKTLLDNVEPELLKKPNLTHKNEIKSISTFPKSLQKTSKLISNVSEDSSDEDYQNYQDSEEAKKQREQEQLIRNKYKSLSFPELLPLQTNFEEKEKEEEEEGKETTVDKINNLAEKNTKNSSDLTKQQNHSELSQKDSDMIPVSVPISQKQGWLGMDLEEALSTFLTRKYLKESIKLAKELESQDWRSFPDDSSLENMVSIIRQKSKPSRDHTRDVTIFIPWKPGSQEPDLILFKRILRGSAYYPWLFDTDWWTISGDIGFLLTCDDIQIQLAYSSHYDFKHASKLLRRMASYSEDIPSDHPLLQEKKYDFKGDIYYFPAADILQNKCPKNYCYGDDSRIQRSFKDTNDGNLAVLDLLADIEEEGPDCYKKIHA